MATHTYRKFRDATLIRAFFKELTEKEIEKIVTIREGDRAGEQVQINKNRTHKLSLEIKTKDGKEWFSGGSVTFRPGDPQVLQKKLDEVWTNIYNGAIISFKVKDGNFKDGNSGERWNASIIWDKFELEENAEDPGGHYIYKQGEGGGNTGSGNSGDKSDKPSYSPIGIKVGHCGTTSSAFLANTKLKPTAKNIEELGQYFNDITQRLEKEMGINGQAAGNAVNCACRLCKKREDVEPLAKVFATSARDVFTPFIKGGGTLDTDESQTESVDDNDIDEDDIPF